jgi:phosphoribosyl-ATP pyrophosphohydrolase
VDDAGTLGAKVYDAGYSGVNIFDLDGLSERERISETTGMFRRVFRLGEVQAYTLYKCISYTYNVCMRRGMTPTMRDLMFTMWVFIKHAGKTEANILESLEKRMMVLVGDGLSRSVSMAKVMDGRSIFSLESLHTSESQAVYMESMLKKVYTMMIGRKRAGAGRFYVVIDEAEKLQNSPVVARLVAEGRKYGIGVVAISQRAKALDKEIRSNAATMIAFAQREPEEQSYVANLIAGGNEYNRFMEVRKAMRELRRGQALVQGTRSRNPFIARCDRFVPGRRDPRYRILRLARNAASLRELTVRLGREGFDEESVIRAIGELEKEGTLKRHFVSESEYRGTWYISMPRNSAEHDIMVNLVSRHLSRMGVRNIVYNKAYGPDVIAFAEGGPVAVEYETGKKNPESTERMLSERRKAYSQVIVLGPGAELPRDRECAEPAQAESQTRNPTIRRSPSTGG